ncbi:MAG: Thermostable beta-glucosidase B [Candidatus Ordinivivax streblomastigis]|uniref:Thermostable beta-glucosidase B n=1 Tax=Candidatus Ordinivivax streblomastigis TaxID=2540710 RepID=A0A5M8P3P5_9BACT|nr:MAG: Thermostable beta-glucosidase B [Candidatus Ordinivivax streblomastigis]
MNRFIKTMFILAGGLLPVIAMAEPAEGNPAFARLAGPEGTVLLKNNHQTLPLAHGAKIALFGINQVDYVKGGGGSGDVNVPYTRHFVYGLLEKEKEGKIDLYSELTNFYQTAYNNGSRNAREPEISNHLMTEAKRFADTAVLCIGRYSEEGSDRKAEKGDYYLSDSEENLIKQIIAAGFQHLVVVFNVGGIVDTQWFKDNQAIDAVVLAWQAGMEGGNVLADILTGDAYPSGKLADTFAKSYTDYPASATFKQSENFVNYEEDIFVGYRYFETLPKAAAKVNYEFGFGLSYTTFAISGISAKAQGDSIVIQAQVKNTGARSGKEVVQVYFSAPKGKLDKPAKELAAFRKTRELAPNESQTLTLTFPIADMSSYDDLDKVFPASYVLEKGKYKFLVGNSVRNVKETAWQYEVKKDRAVQTLSHQVQPKELAKRLLSSGKYEELTNLPSSIQAIKSVADNNRPVTEKTSRIRLQDVYKNRALMSQFLAELTTEELILLAGGRPNGAYSNTGGMGFLPHLGIPNILTADGPAGLRIWTTATAWPCGTQQACSWNPDLVEEIGQRVADECVASGTGIWLAPGMNIHRDPLCGRNFEYYSEDPLLCGKTAAALTKGVQSKKIAITLKHFACNNKETNRNSSDSRVSERALREIYLKGFEIAVKESGPWAMMTSYNLINGKETSENYELLTNILRNEWGYDGLVMTDWWNNSSHVLESKAGNDIKMPSGDANKLRSALKNGSLTRAELEHNIERLLNLIMKTNTWQQTK